MENEPRRTGTGCAWPIAIFLIVLALLGATLFYLVGNGMVKMPGAFARQMGEQAARLSKVFATEVKVDSQSVTLESREILELATVQHRIVCVTKYTTKWAGSTATLVIRGVFTAKAGFNLEGGTTFRLNEAGEVSDESIPPAKILSITTNEQSVFFDAQGILKSLDSSDYQEAFRQNREQAQREAEQMGIREEARTRLKERLGDMLANPKRGNAPLPLAPQL